MRPTCSALLGRTWIAPDGTRVALTIPEAGLLETVEQEWSPGRSTTNAHWSWPRIAITTNETFALRATTGEVIALWAAEARVRSIARHRCYRLEFLEVAPEHCGKRMWGLLAMVVAAARAAELGARGLVFRGLPERAPWYGRLGARPVSKYAWKAPSGTVRLSIVGGAFDALIEVANGDQAR